jgi:predicted ABC-type ATPase
LRGSVSEPTKPSRINVLAGTNGAGKSSVVGATIEAAGLTYFNPDDATRELLADNPGMTLVEANSLAWQRGTQGLQRAIDDRINYAFETTLGGKTITRLLETALAVGVEVKVWYVGLSSPELHLARVRARVTAGGHDIPEQKIRERYDQSRYNLIHLLPKLTELRVYDNSEDADPLTGVAPEPKLVLHMVRKRIVEMCDLTAAPEWTRVILMEAIDLQK